MVTAEKRRSAILSIFGQVIGFYGTFKAVLSVLKVIFELGSNRKKSTKDVEIDTSGRKKVQGFFVFLGGFETGGHRVSAHTCVRHIEQEPKHQSPTRSMDNIPYELFSFHDCQWSQQLPSDFLIHGDPLILQLWWQARGRAEEAYQDFGRFAVSVNSWNHFYNWPIYVHGRRSSARAGVRHLVYHYFMQS